MIKMRLGGSDDPLEPFPQKPRGMHRRTYRRLREQARAADADADGLLADSMPGFKELPPAIAAPIRSGALSQRVPGHPASVGASPKSEW